MSKLNYLKRFTIFIPIIILIVALGIITIVVLAQEQPVPENLSLKASKDKILGHKEIDWIAENENGKLENKGKIIKYAYNSNMRIGTEPSNEILSQARKNNLSITGELIDKRTKYSKTFATNNPRQFVSEFISGVPQYYKDSSDN